MAAQIFFSFSKNECLITVFCFRFYKAGEFEWFWQFSPIYIPEDCWLVKSLCIEVRSIAFQL